MTSVLGIGFRAYEDEVDSGFAMGELCLQNLSSGAKACFSTMVVVSATLLLDQLASWSEETACLRFHPVDGHGFVEFQREAVDVVVTARGQELATVEEGALMQAAFLGCSSLYARVAKALSQGDAGRQDLEASLSAFAFRMSQDPSR